MTTEKHEPTDDKIFRCIMNLENNLLKNVNIIYNESTYKILTDVEDFIYNFASNARTPQEI